MKFSSLALVFVLFASTVHADEPAKVSLKASMAAIVAAQAADMITTHVALSNPNIHEVVMTQSALKNDLLLGGLAAAEITLLTHAQNKKAARIAGFCIAAFHGYISYRNLQVIRAAGGR